MSNNAAVKTGQGWTREVSGRKEFSWSPGKSDFSQMTNLNKLNEQFSDIWEVELVFMQLRLMADEGQANSLHITYSSSYMTPFSFHSCLLLIIDIVQEWIFFQILYRLFVGTKSSLAHNQLSYVKKVIWIELN